MSERERERSRQSASPSSSNTPAERRIRTIGLFCAALSSVSGSCRASRRRSQLRLRRTDGGTRDRCESRVDRARAPESKKAAGGSLRWLDALLLSQTLTSCRATECEAGLTIAGEEREKARGRVGEVVGRGELSPVVVVVELVRSRPARASPGAEFERMGRPAWRRQAAARPVDYLYALTHIRRICSKNEQVAARSSPISSVPLVKVPGLLRVLAAKSFDRRAIPPHLSSACPRT